MPKKAFPVNVKTDFEFGWKSWKKLPPYAEPTFRHQMGDILDVGCGTCQLLIYLREKGWRGRYFGIDSRKYEDAAYPQDAQLIIGDAFKAEFPPVDTIVLNNILEHLDDPLPILTKSLTAAKSNVLICVPKRNEELWRHGLAEYHQLDKSHKHCGFSRDEVSSLIGLAGGRIASYEELNPITAANVERFWKRFIPRAVMRMMSAVFETSQFYQEIWCEVVRV